MSNPPDVKWVSGLFKSLVKMGQTLPWRPERFNAFFDLVAVFAALVITVVIYLLAQRFKPDEIIMNLFITWGVAIFISMACLLLVVIERNLRKSPYPPAE